MLHRVTAVLLAVLALAVAGPAAAVTFTFASFSYVGPAVVTYDNATGSLTGITIPVKFNYVSAPIFPAPATGYGDQDAVLTFAASRQGNAMSFLGVGFQEMSLDSFSLTRTTPFMGMTNLLSGSVSKSVLSGTLGGSAASKLGSVGAGASVTYASDFITFPPPTDADFAWALQSVSPPLSITGANFTSFDATVAGTFGYNYAAIPEGSSMALLGAGLLPLALVIRRRVARK